MIKTAIILVAVLWASVYLADRTAKKYFGAKISDQMGPLTLLILGGVGSIICFNYCVNMTITAKEFMASAFFMAISSIVLSIVFCVLLSLDLIHIPKTVILKIDALLAAAAKPICRLPTILKPYPNLNFIIAIMMGAVMASSVIGIVIVNKYILAIIYDINPSSSRLRNLLVLVLEFLGAVPISIGMWKVYGRNGSAK